MSASEKLKALEAIAPPVNNPHAKYPGYALTRALPQLVAAFAAVEECDPGGPGWFGDSVEGDKIAAALAAVEEVLP